MIQNDLNKALNDYTLVVQEFFHLRVDAFLKTIGYETFGIKHFWGRFEFAKSRGQIHLHLLGITDDVTGDNGIHTKLFACKNDNNAQTNILAQWMREKFNFTAEISPESVDTEESTCPCKIRFREVADITQDQQALSQFCQIHKCSEYCMRTNKNMQGNPDMKSKTNITVSFQPDLPEG